MSALTRQLIINSTSYETRVALIEGGIVSEYYIERTKEKGIVGNIYLGRVVRVLPGMQSCFVDIGLDRAAFLFAGDIQTEDNLRILDKLDEEEDASQEDDLSDDSEENHTRSRHHYKEQKIQDLVKEGQKIVVQVVKDAINTKGARLRTYLSLPGRYVVVTPGIHHIGISKKIRSEEERERLKAIAQKVQTRNMGIVIRTASEGVDEEKLATDIKFLINVVENIKAKEATSECPSLIHEDLNLIFRTTRDLMSQNLDRIVIDNKEHYEELVRFLNRFSIKFGAYVHLYEGHSQIFDAFGIEHEIAGAMESKIWLKSGGYIIIESTEALTAIDVNTGRFVGNKNLSDTIVKTNIEAVRAIVRQLRLRNIGGIIVLDFIDMDRQEDRDRVFYYLQEELKKDKAKTTVLRVSEMGLIQMTRKRTEESLLQKITVPCSYCEGKGHTKSAITMSYEIFHELLREFEKTDFDSYLISAHPMIIDRFMEEDSIFLEEIKTKHKKKIFLKSLENSHVEYFEVTPIRES